MKLFGGKREERHKFYFLSFHVELKKLGDDLNFELLMRLKSSKLKLSKAGKSYEFPPRF